MSTQSTHPILFTHSAPQQAFRLLELTPELVGLLTKEGGATLQLKSPAQSQPHSQKPTDQQQYVNLCTPTQTYRIREVQSSNSLHIIRPSDGGAKRGDINIVGGAGAQVGEEGLNLDLVDTMTAVAKCGSTLELDVPSGGFSARPFLEGLVGGLMGMMGMMMIKERGDIIRRVFDDVPLSLAECERGWVELCAFVLPCRGESRSKAVSEQCRRPSAQVKIDVWKRAMEGAVLQGIDLEKQFLVRDLWKSVLEEDDDGSVVEPFPRDLFEAVVRRVCESGEELGGLFDDAQMKWASIDKTKCLQWVGETYLEAVAPSTKTAVGRVEFLAAWKNHLPESWRDEVALSKLTNNSYKLPDPTTICYVNEADRQKLKNNLSTDISADTAAKKSRNWHELFKNKRQKR
ncbi:putative sister chromatid cohesion protein Dcc1 [Aspergillus campestris IBT 28561]|uniref:Sister chromatid cohesion protein Dcc1 n=1 Tax=Aspergillus campestris (strain IBT 28561) TaxID=1392248 RepID=A0A2I1D6K2_ASPC2|nr:putative sister chromatid cohesion protein Dcc1 [Aspergillus campestris IBT 28561]PKY05506.1 putative sister chromatid cohesion protein Dcc1 [Aspergillus campestris IBT 28561]